MTWQCVQALEVLLAQKVLSPEAIVAAHATMMHGAYGMGSHAREGFAPGLRTSSARAGSYEFPASEEVGPGLERLVSAFEERLGTVHVAKLAADLLCDFVTLHPFENGNGRMCRMLFAYAVHRCGFPFTCCVTSDDEPYKDYISALRRAQTNLSISRRYDVYWLAIFSIGAAVANAREFLQLGECKGKRTG